MLNCDYSQQIEWDNIEILWMPTFSDAQNFLTTIMGIIARFFDRIKGWIAWSWTYLWAVWFGLVLFVVYILRGPLKLGENITYGEYNYEILWNKNHICIMISGFFLKVMQCILQSVELKWTSTKRKSKCATHGSMGSDLVCAQTIRFWKSTVTVMHQLFLPNESANHIMANMDLPFTFEGYADVKEKRIPWVDYRWAKKRIRLMRYVQQVLGLSFEMFRNIVFEVNTITCKDSQDFRGKKHKNRRWWKYEF